jgi:hypothetical protein
MKRVYVAGAYSASDVITVLANMRRGIEMSYKVLEAGMAPFCPWLDYQFLLQDSAGKITVEDMYEYSLSWLRGAEALLVLPNFGKSKGTLKEIEEAERLGIPRFYSLKDLIEWHLKSQ